MVFLAAFLLIVCTLAGCANTIGPISQTVEVRVETPEADRAGPLECEASNAAGAWQFVAPGTVTVRISSPLWITCKVPPGTVAERIVVAAQSSDAAREAAGKGARTGAVAGGAAGVALGIAAAPVMGALGVALAAGSAFRGAQIGGAVGLLKGGGPMSSYPQPIVIRIRPIAFLQ